MNPTRVPPFQGHEPTAWVPPWLGRVLSNMRSYMISRPPQLPGMAEQSRNTSAVRNEGTDVYGTRLFANWAAGGRSGPPVEGAQAYAPVTAGANRFDDTTFDHPGPERAPEGPQSVDRMVPPFSMFDPGTPGTMRTDALAGDEYARQGDDRRSFMSDTLLQQGPNPGDDVPGIPASFRIPRQFRMGLAHMAGPSQWGMPQHQDGGKRGDTLIVRPPSIGVTDGANARAIRGILGSVRASDTSHVPAVFTPNSVG